MKLTRFLYYITCALLILLINLPFSYSYLHNIREDTLVIAPMLQRDKVYAQRDQVVPVTAGNWSYWGLVPSLHFLKLPPSLFRLMPVLYTVLACYNQFRFSINFTCDNFLSTRVIVSLINKNVAVLCDFSQRSFDNRCPLFLPRWYLFYSSGISPWNLLENTPSLHPLSLQVVWVELSQDPRVGEPDTGLYNQFTPVPEQ